MQLWAASRFIEEEWYISGGDTLDIQPIPDREHANFDRIPVTPIMDYQLDQVVIRGILNPLRASLSEALQTLIHEHNPENWFTIFLCSFVLLHNYELATRHDYHTARLRGLSASVPLCLAATISTDTRVRQTTYSNTPLLRELHMGARTLLAHLPYINKGHRPFSTEHWSANPDANFATLGPAQLEYVQGVANAKKYWGKCADGNAAPVSLAGRSRADWRVVRQWKLDHDERDYKAEGYLVSQLFDPGWTPDYFSS